MKKALEILAHHVQGLKFFKCNSSLSVGTKQLSCLRFGWHCAKQSQELKWKDEARALGTSRILVVPFEATVFREVGFECS